LEAHGCLEATSGRIVNIELVTVAAGSSKITPATSTHFRGGNKFMRVDPKVINGVYSNRGETKTLGWLWRLQVIAEPCPATLILQLYLIQPYQKAKAGYSFEEYDGVAFDLYQFQEKAMRVTIQTKQKYEALWTSLCLLIFFLRLAIYVLVECLALNYNIFCRDEADDVIIVGANTKVRGKNTAEVGFLQCAPSVRTYVLLVVLVLLDFANILNPIYNVTAVQQGEFLWSGLNMEVVSVIGYSACKLELALVPATITVLGRMLTGSNDIILEAFLFQTGVFVMPLILPRWGYNFALNTSTICQMIMLAFIAVRFAWRLHGNPMAGAIMCSDDMLAVLDEDPDADNMPLHIALGSWDPTIMVDIQLDTVCAIRGFLIGLQMTTLPEIESDSEAPVVMPWLGTMSLPRRPPPERPPPQGGGTLGRIWGRQASGLIVSWQFPDSPEALWGHIGGYWGLPRGAAGLSLMPPPPHASAFSPPCSLPFHCSPLPPPPPCH
jgi:hypothetical protein